MPGSRRGLVAPQNTFLESIVRKCSGARKYNSLIILVYLHRKENVGNWLTTNYRQPWVTKEIFQLNRSASSVFFSWQLFSSLSVSCLILLYWNMSLTVRLKECQFSILLFTRFFPNERNILLVRVFEYLRQETMSEPARADKQRRKTIVNDRWSTN